MKITWVPYWMVRTGERFRFVYNPYFNPRIGEKIFVKGKSGWFADEEGRKFRTGRDTAVTINKEHQ
jgi:hypothetical protein